MPSALPSGGPETLPGESQSASKKAAAQPAPAVVAKKGTKRTAKTAKAAKSARR